MGDFLYHSTHFMLKMLDKIFKTNIKVTGLENLSIDAPTLFVANHFTRAETLLVPYAIHQHTAKNIRSLADRSLFVGLLGSYLEQTGTLSTADKNRDAIIIGDLMSGRKNWLIYPEGNMIKNKKITKADEFIMHTPDREGSVHTGSAMLAMKAQLLKSELRYSIKNANSTRVDQIKDSYFLDDDNLAYHSTIITPINITYTPLRNGENSMMKMASVFMGDKDIPSMHEELEIEGNLLSNAQMHIHFCKPLNLAHYLHHAKCTECFDVTQDRAQQHRTLVGNFRHHLTTQFMDTIYQNTLITFDHVFASILHQSSRDRFTTTELKQLIFLAFDTLDSLKIYRIDSSSKLESFKLLNSEPSSMFDSILSVAIEQSILKPEGNSSYTVDRDALNDKHTFHTIRLKNTLLVIYNEISLLDEFKRSIDQILNRDPQSMREDVFYRIYRKDLAIFKDDYSKNYSIIRSKPQDVGAPFVLYNPKFTTGIVFSHGYKSAPLEIRAFGEYLHSKGYNFYGVRLKGHGTLPEDLRDTTYKQWYDSFERGFCAMRQVSKKLIIGGFSTGGLIALLAASQKQSSIDGIICINTAIKLNDIRINYIVPTLNMFNDFLALFNADLKYIESDPENPHINYRRNYIKSVAQLKKLIEQVDNNLPKITAPTLIVQADSDPVVNPQSAHIIYNKIGSKKRQILNIESDRHVIMSGKNSDHLFKKSLEFIEQI